MKHDRCPDWTRKLEPVLLLLREFGSLEMEKNFVGHFGVFEEQGEDVKHELY